MAQLAVQAVVGPEIGYEQLLAEYPNVVKLLLAAALGILLGTEREWSQKPAGMRTFTFIAIAGTITTITGETLLVALGGLLVVFQGMVLAGRGLFDADSGFLLTTSVAMVVTYGIGVMVGQGLHFAAVVISIVATLLLVARRELHDFAENLSKSEIRSAIEFGVIAFVVFPVLPNESLGPWGAVNPRTVWLLVVAVSAIGFFNYLIVQRYGTKGIAITSFFGGLVNSTAVIGEIASRTKHNRDLSSIGVGAILLADAAMALRDLVIVGGFVPRLVPTVGLPLVAITVTGVALSYVLGDWDTEMDLSFESPFNLRTALSFGGLFLVVLLLSAGAQSIFGSSGFLVTSFFSGLLSSGAVTTTVVVLYTSGQLTPIVATAGVLVGVGASILVKVGIAASINRSLVKPTAVASLALLAAGVVTMGLLTLW